MIFYCPIVLRCSVCFHYFHTLYWKQLFFQCWLSKYCPWVARCLCIPLFEDLDSFFMCPNSGVCVKFFLSFSSFLFFWDPGVFISKGNFRLLNIVLIFVFISCFLYNSQEKKLLQSEPKHICFPEVDSSFSGLPTEIIVDLIILWSFPPRLPPNL